jgi:hypothetical protein
MIQWSNPVPPWRSKFVGTSRIVECEALLKANDPTLTAALSRHLDRFGSFPTKDDSAWYDESAGQIS